MSLYTELLAHEQAANFFALGHVKRFAPGEIRQTIQDLLSDPQHHDLAHALGDAGFAIYPQDEEILTINAFLSMMKQNWDQLSEYLVPLIRIRGDRTQSNEFVVLSESFQKRMEYKVAIEIVAQGLVHYPDNGKLKAIHQELIAMMSFVGGERFSQ